MRVQQSLRFGGLLIAAFLMANYMNCTEMRGFSQIEGEVVSSASEAPSASVSESPPAQKPSRLLFLANAAMFRNPSWQKEMTLEKEWQKVRESYRSSARSAAASAPALYNVQLVLSSFVEQAYQRDKLSWMHDLMEIYLEDAVGLKTVSALSFYYPVVGGKSLGRTASLPALRPLKVWLYDDGVENVLTSAQYLYPVTMILMWIAKKNLYATDPLARRFFDTYFKVALQDHYQRWIFNRDIPIGTFQVTGWGCTAGNFSHRQHLQNILDRVYKGRASYCNVMTDTDLFILAGVAHLMAVRDYRKEAPEIAMTDGEYAALGSYFQLGMRTFAAHVEFGSARNVSGQAVETAVFEMGAYGDHPDFAYSADTDPSFPGWMNAGEKPKRPPKPAARLSFWDISHARRLVNFMWTLHETNPVLHLVDPGIEPRYTAAFARQIAFRVFAGDLTKPRFSNYLDGTNGWYRVNYSGRPGFGYEPGSGSLRRAIIDGGYGAWDHVDPFLGELIYKTVLADGYKASGPYGCLQILSAIPDKYFPELLAGPRAEDGSLCRF